jgi:membrane-associated phospholipid phosphatase
MALGLACLTVDARTHGPIARFEERSLRAPGPRPSWAAGTSFLAEKQVVLCTSLAVVAHRSLRGNDEFSPVVRLLGGVAVRALFARAMRRPRPPQGWWRAQPHGWSFPSRHATHALLVAGMVLDEADSMPRVVKSVAMTGFVATVAASRLRLGVHWPTDVVGGALTALLWRRLTEPAVKD